MQAADDDVEKGERRNERQRQDKTREEPGKGGLMLDFAY